MSRNFFDELALERATADFTGGAGGTHRTCSARQGPEGSRREVRRRMRCSSADLCFELRDTAPAGLEKEPPSFVKHGASPKTLPPRHLSRGVPRGVTFQTLGTHRLAPVRRLRGGFFRRLAHLISSSRHRTSHRSQNLTCVVAPPS